MEQQPCPCGGRMLLLSYNYVNNLLGNNDYLLYALAIEVEKGMFPEGTAPYFPKIVYTPYRG